MIRLYRLGTFTEFTLRFWVWLTLAVMYEHCGQESQISAVFRLIIAEKSA